ncbi:hypothetical protein OE494_29435 [Pseudomonas aeruginosa]|uniref:hypothetical protein n=1 Tax=Pseudomonas aeruginosa TaxID=287 RepID=UPI00053D194B|nr:hypothetical protein [Pseudomonas aeruginosa]EJS3802561.1 hypothetical protein [Pseudomonas aeruginosa]EJS3851962.1 hypothetical protein [Pseudomonas aeruginosa]EKE3927992.1 hypothetical protein [Pseudomonas aeruginosa]EKJ7673894.1 hypothetical protein [Pseudomonas aeruginosa]EKK5032206.1 hypothetical protein [Pseudomonas aeruginosa]
MQTTYVGQDKFIQRGGRIFRFTDDSAEAATNAEWADGVLARENVRYPNGRMSHEVAGEVLEKAEDTLLDFLCVTA